ncbi:MAG TPA: transglycosylase family protein [Acidimicrobiales bacterium]|nr:transglycosylase family protein [Acidimicrobiales bacterium]
MPERTDHPPSTDDSTSRLSRRRAAIGGVAGIALLVGPVLLANVIVPGDNGEDRVEAAAVESATSLVALRRSANQADLAKGQAIASMRTTTTTAPPPPPTEPPPPPTTEEPTTTTRPEPASTEEPPADSGAGFGDPSDYATWDALAQCEAGGNWSINTGNGYYGGLQFSLSSWQSVGGTGLPSDASRETQILMGQRLQARSGWGSWPACSSKLGLR